MLKQHTYHFFLSLFFLKDSVIAYEDQMFHYFQNWQIQYLFYIITLLNSLYFNFFHNFSCLIQRVYDLTDFSFLDVLSALTFPRAIGNLWSLCLGVNILIWVIWVLSLFCYLFYELIISIDSFFYLSNFI